MGSSARIAISGVRTGITWSPEPRAGKPGSESPVATPLTRSSWRAASPRIELCTLSSFCPTRTITVPLE